MLGEHPELEVNWCPCEAHPRSEEPDRGRHSDLALKGMHYLADRGGDLLPYHARVYRAIFADGKDIEDPDVLAACAEGLVEDLEDFKRALGDERYATCPDRANDYAYRHHKVWAVPSYVMGDRRLDAVEGVGVTRAQIEALLSGRP